MQENNKQISPLKKVGYTLKTYLIEHPTEALQLAKQAGEVWAMNKQYAKEINSLKESNKFELEKISKKYELARTTLELIFSERTNALSGCYNTLEQALKNNDRETIIETLRSISKIVSANPLESFDLLTKALDDPNKTLMLDF